MRVAFHHGNEQRGNGENVTAGSAKQADCFKPQRNATTIYTIDT